MAKKTFQPRVSKKKREKIDLTEKIGRSLPKIGEERLLSGARLDELRLDQIIVNEQVRTKFVDSSIKELADNIRANGLIQPLVVHYSKGKHTLICGERRYRAMSSIEMKEAPCFILENKTDEELMAIQFSENSSREALHYIDKADGILNYQKATKASERKITQALGISKSEVHRSLIIAKLPKRVREAAKIHNVEKYVLVEYSALDDADLKKKVQAKIVKGEVTKRAQLKSLLKKGVVSSRKRKTASVPKGLTAAAFLKAMNSKTKNMDLDPETLKALKKIVEETKDIVDM